TLPCVSRKVSNAAKLELATARPRTAPAGPFSSCAAAAFVRLSRVRSIALVAVDAVGDTDWVELSKSALGRAASGRLSSPTAPARPHAAQLTPDRDWSAGGTPP